MTLDQAIERHEDLAMRYIRSSISKKYYNEEASEADARIGEEYRLIAQWLKELKEYRELGLVMKEERDNED